MSLRSIHAGAPRGTVNKNTAGGGGWFLVLRTGLYDELYPDYRLPTATGPGAGLPLPVSKRRVRVSSLGSAICGLVCSLLELG